MNIILMGRSGCGKGTQGKLLAEYIEQQEPKKPVLYVQTGAVLRTFKEKPGYTAQEIKKIYDKGELMPEFITVYTWSTILIEQYTGIEHLIIDGTPRKPAEAHTLDSIFEFYKIPRALVVHLNVSREISRQRLLDRKRSDDTPADIEKRLNWFDEYVVPTINYYRNNPAYMFIELNGEEPIATTQEQLKQALTAWQERQKV
jgi:adenylate kinase family enzyme